MDPITKTIMIVAFSIGILTFIFWVVDRESKRRIREKELVPPDCFSIDDIYIIFINDRKLYTERLTRRSLKNLCKQFEMCVDLESRSYILKNVSFTYEVQLYRSPSYYRTDIIHELRIPFDKHFVQSKQNMNFMRYADEGDLSISQSINSSDYRGSYHICYKI